MNIVPNATNANAFGFKIFFKIPKPYTLPYHSKSTYAIFHLNALHRFFIFFILQHYVPIHNKTWDTEAEIKFVVCKDVYTT